MMRMRNFSQKRRLLWISSVFGVLCVWELVAFTNTRVLWPFTGTRDRTDSSQIFQYPQPMAIDLRALPRVKRNYPNVFSPQTDPETCANALTSKYKLSSLNSQFQMGETIQIEIQLFDSYKQRKKRGGDFVRIWMKEESKNASAAGVIVDHHDGTYTGSLIALWSGSPLIEVSVASPRERMEIFYRIYRDHYSLLHYFTGIFQSEGVEEATACLPIPQIPGYTHVCNLTSENYGLPWYCGKPSHRHLLCHDFTGLKPTGGQPWRFTTHEERFFDSRTLHQKIPTPIRIKVVSATDRRYVPLPTTPCNKSPLRQSWEASTPVGFFYKNHWKSLTCNNTIGHDINTYRKCLKNRTLWIHGDSTSRYWFLGFNDVLKMDLVTEPWVHEKWHKPSVLRNEHLSSTLMFIPHEYPFYHGANKLAYNRAAHAYLDALPSDSTDIFVIHIYLHFIPTPPELYRSHIRRIAKSVRSLVARAPGLKLAIRGTHAFRGAGRIGFLNDCWMFLFDSIIREEFKGLEDKILYLNNIDLTIATENDDAHPNTLARTALMHHLMGRVCDG